MHKIFQLTLWVLALALVASITYSPATACKKYCCAADKEIGSDHGHEQLDEEEGFVTILGKGHTDGWTLDKHMKIDEEGVLHAGTMDEKLPETLYAYYEKNYDNFELRAQAKKQDPEKTNGGFQIRSAVNDKGQVIGYLADMGRRNSLLTRHEEGIDLQKDINWDDWNDYRVVCKDNVTEVHINGKLFCKHTEADADIAKATGKIGLQMHASPPNILYYRKTRIKMLD